MAEKGSDVAGNSDEIGDRGETIFKLAITDYRQFDRPLFRPAFLGEKWPHVDYYVELTGIPRLSPYFFVQVKSTAVPLAASATSLKVSASKAKCEGLFRRPGPTYLVGVHEPTARAFIASLHMKPRKGVYQIPLSHELNPENLMILHREVADFWKSNHSKPTRSHFS